jgi:lipoprotein NlpI
MKKILVLTMTMMLLSVISQAQFVVFDIKRIIMEFITDDLLMEQDEKIQREKLIKLLEILTKVKEIRARNTEMLKIHEEIELTLRSIKEVEHLSLHDITQILQKVAAISKGLYAGELPYLDEYIALFDLAPGIQNTNSLYEYLLGSTTAYSHINHGANLSYSDNTLLLQEQAIKRYNIETDAAKRMLHLALSHEQLSKDLAQQAVDLSQHVSTEGSWRLFGTGDIFSDLFEEEISLPGIELPSLGDIIQDWTKEIGQQLKAGSLFKKDDADEKEGEIKDRISDKMGGFDFFGLLETLTGGIEGVPPAPQYEAEIEKAGIRMTTGERIEAQETALDHMMQSIQLQLKADELTIEAIRKTEHQRKIDATYENALIRKSLTKINI